LANLPVGVSLERLWLELLRAQGSARDISSGLVAKDAEMIQPILRPHQFLHWQETRQRFVAAAGRIESTETEGMTLNIQELFGQIDIYVFDQILRGNIAPRMRILDAGCGYGRNLVYLLREHFEIFAIDSNDRAVEQVRRLSKSIGSALPDDNFQVSPVEKMPFPSEFADVVMCSSVLHFARSEEQFQAMIAELWRVLRPGGLLFCRLGSRIGMDFIPVGNGLFAMPDGQNWYLVDEQKLMALTATLKAALIDPLKTTIVQNQRCMTTWVVRKPQQLR
jgi:SAM-dependent methyltransferase